MRRGILDWQHSDFPGFPKENPTWWAEPLGQLLGIGSPAQPHSVPTHSSAMTSPATGLASTELTHSQPWACPAFHLPCPLSCPGPTGQHSSRASVKIYNFPGPRMEEDQWESPGAVVSLEILGGAIGERREGAECVTPQATKDLLRVSRGSI